MGESKRMPESRHDARPAGGAPPRVASGESTRTRAGLHGDQGRRQARRGDAGGAPAAAGRPKPPWLRAPHGRRRGLRRRAGRSLREHRLATVCEEAKCPNIGECWNAGTATIMVMGAVCTRACRFCAVDTGNPRGWLDAEEPANVAASVAAHAAASTWCSRRSIATTWPTAARRTTPPAMRAIKARTPRTAVEALTPDFQGVMRDVETGGGFGSGRVRAEHRDRRRLTHPVRDPRAGYRADPRRCSRTPRRTGPAC